MIIGSSANNPGKLLELFRGWANYYGKQYWNPRQSRASDVLNSLAFAFRNRYHFWDCRVRAWAFVGIPNPFKGIFMRFGSFAGRALMVAGLTGLLGSPMISYAGSPTAAVVDANSIEARQFRITNARLPGQASGRQTVTAWQVTTGSWNGQTLDGLSVVLVQSSTDIGRASGQVHCYVSHEATTAQREALLGAFLTAMPNVARDSDAMRVEAAVITLEIDGQTVVLHLGLIA
jgi:hypothetical protein